MLRVRLICALPCTFATLPCSSSAAALASCSAAAALALLLLLFVPHAYAATLCLVLTCTYVADAIWYISALVLTRMCKCANVDKWPTGHQISQESVP